MRKEERRRKTLPIADILPRILEKIERKSGGKLPVIVVEWVEIVGEEVARHTEPVSMNNKRLIVEVDDSVWMAELSRFHRKRMVEAVNNKFGKEIIRDIIFRPKSRK